MYQFIFVSQSGKILSNYKKKSARQPWDDQEMMQAIEAVVDGEMGCFKASRIFNVPRSTLTRRVESLTIDDPDIKKRMLNFRTVLTHEQEKEILDHILAINSTSRGLTRKDVRSLAYQLAERDKVKHNFNNQEKLAGKDWLTGFRKRHPELCLMD